MSALPVTKDDYAQGFVCLFNSRSTIELLSTNCFEAINQKKMLLFIIIIAITIMIVIIIILSLFLPYCWNTFF